MRKKLTLLEQAQVEERKLHLDRLGKAEKSAKDTLTLLAIMLPQYKPQPKQAQFHASAAYEKGLKGGYGSGKTIALCAEAIALAYVNRPRTIILASPSEKIIEETTYRTLKELCDANDLAFDYQSTSGRFTLLFGHDRREHGQILLIGQSFYKGPNIAALGLDEPFSQRRSIVDNLMARVRSHTAQRLEVFWAGTAEPELMEWGVEYFERDHDSAKLFTVTIPTRENRFLPPSYVESLESRFDAKMQEIYLEGKYVLRSANPVYHAFERRKNEERAVEVGSQRSEVGSQKSEMILGFDFNVDPMTCVLIRLIGRTYYQEREFVVHNSSTAEICGAVIAYLCSISDQWSTVNDQRSIIVTGDASGRKRGTRGNLSDYEIIRDAFMKAEIPLSFHVPMENPAVRDRVNYVNKLFETVQFVIDPRCEQSIKDRELVSWKATGEGFVIDKSKKDRTHLSDAADYAVYNTKILIETGDEGGLVQTLPRRRR